MLLDEAALIDIIKSSLLSLYDPSKGTFDMVAQASLYC